MDSDVEDAVDGTVMDLKGLPLAARLALLSSGTVSRPAAGSGGLAGKKRRRAPAETRGVEEEKPSNDTALTEDKKTKQRRKGAPKEMPSNMPVARLVPAIGAKKTKARDPRFDEACGKVDYQMFRKAYNFLDDYQETEILAIKKRMKKEKPGERLEELTNSLRKAQQERGERRKKDRLLNVKQKAKQEERRKVADGKQPFYLKKREVKRRELEQRYDELSASGKLEDKLTRKRKKNFGKDLRWIPKDRKVAGDT